MAKEWLKEYQFKKGDKKAVEAGKKSKRKPSIQAALIRQFQSGEVDLDKYAKSIILQAMKGNGPYAKLVSEYIDGKVPQPVAVSGELDTSPSKQMKDLTDQELEELAEKGE